ncbi:MAG: hypothetical protein L0241_15575, partial [Planctomycetia bacterium]|nr:hypothetical protein [Planctomycetia bacterium]
MTPLFLLSAIALAQPEPAGGNQQPGVIAGLRSAIPLGPQEFTDLKLPPGFTARIVADHALAPDIYTMTIDDEGRVLVAGPGYVRVLVDTDNDGRADRAVDLLDGLKDGPMGLLVEDDSLFVVADGGLKRYTGYNGKDKLKGPPETLLALKTTSEHHAHAVRRGPDGWLYLLCGNMAGVRKEIITDGRSPVKEPVAGALVRISPDFKSVEVVADGFRNPYSFDFNLDGEPFTYDSDNERCVGLPWYEACRFYHVVPGGNYGWRSPQLGQFWRKPAYFPDVVAPICYLGRGSPTGVACYRHTSFPKHYQGGFFLADWTFGRIHFVPLKVSGSTYIGEPEVFAESTGTSGFAPTALAVHPMTGELFVSIGGRGTRGGVYRITFDKGEVNPKPLPMAKRSLDWTKEASAQWLKDCASDNLRVRRTAMELILRWQEKLAWGEPLFAAVKPNLSSSDELLRTAAARAASALIIPLGNIPRGGRPTTAQLAVALVTTQEDPEWALDAAFGILAHPDSTRRELLTALRIIHLVHGDLTAKDAVGTVWEGYTFRNAVHPRRASKIKNLLINLLERNKGPAQVRIVKLEIARTLAVVGNSGEGAHAIFFMIDSEHSVA